MEYRVECARCGIFMRGSKEADVKITIFGVCDECAKITDNQSNVPLADREDIESYRVLKDK